MVNDKSMIEKLAEYVAQTNGTMEATVRERQRGNAQFAFLFGGEGADYYKECLRRFSASGNGSSGPAGAHFDGGGCLSMSGGPSHQSGGPSAGGPVFGGGSCCSGMGGGMGGSGMGGGGMGGGAGGEDAYAAALQHVGLPEHPLEEEAATPKNVRAAYPSMSPETAERLRAFFAPHNARLGALLGEDWTGWE